MKNEIDNNEVEVEETKKPAPTLEELYAEFEGYVQQARAIHSELESSPYRKRLSAFVDALNESSKHLKQMLTDTKDMKDYVFKEINVITNKESYLIKDDYRRQMKIKINNFDSELDDAINTVNRNKKIIQRMDYQYFKKKYLTSVTVAVVLLISSFVLFFYGVNLKIDNSQLIKENNQIKAEISEYYKYVKYIKENVNENATIIRTIKDLKSEVDRLKGRR